MIEFNGYLSGAAEKAFFRKGRNILTKGYYIVLLFSIPMVFFVGTIFDSNTFFYAIYGFLVLIPLLFFIPQSKKEKLAVLPKKIYTDHEHIVCIAERYTDSKLIADVKEVIDHGEYYELSFPFGKLSDKFICQKDLLTKGTLSEFESLFKGKIRKKTEDG